MKKSVYFLTILLLILTIESFSQMHGGFMQSGNEKNPAMAALLSVQPFPVAIGNFYTGNWERGIIYSAAELSLFIPAMVLLGKNNWSMGMHSYSAYNYSDDRHWNRSERNRFYYFLVGYFLLKIISAFDAGYSAEIYNQNFSVNYDVQNNTAAFSLSVPL